MQSWEIRVEAAQRCAGLGNDDSVMENPHMDSEEGTDYKVFSKY